MDVTDKRQSQELAGRAEIFSGMRIEDGFVANEFRRLPVRARDVESVVKPARVISWFYLAPNLAERPGDFTRIRRRIEWPACREWEWIGLQRVRRFITNLVR